MSLGSKFEYRIVSPDDAEQWRALRLEGVRDFPLSYLVTLEEIQALDVSYARKFLQTGNTRGVFKGKTLVGYAGFHPQTHARVWHRAVIGPFFVTAQCHGSGAAHALLDGMIAEARSSKRTQLELHVDTENYRAIAFYEKYGFQRTGTHFDADRLNGESRDHYFMMLRI